MSFNIDQLLQTFIDEARELLISMEESLLQLESDPRNQDNIGAIFRAAHTIKGSAGLFGLTPIVSFTHVLEDLLDRVRNGEVDIDRHLVALLLECGDHLQELLQVIAVERGDLDDMAHARDKQLRARLQAYHGIALEPVTPSIVVENERLAFDEGAVASDLWHISLRFGPHVFRNGMDPQSFLRYLTTLGDIVSITTLSDAMPSAADMDPESCYLGFEIDFKSAADKNTIANVFAFVADDCAIHILPPHSKIAEYIELIQRLPESEVRLGEILVSSGALTLHELEEGLAQQRLDTNTDGGTNFLGEILVEQRSVETEVVTAALDKQTQVKERKNKESHFIRVQADKLDSLINLVGELVIAGAGANLLAQQAQNTEFQEATSRVSQLVEQIRDGALRMRMVPIGDTFNRFQRVVRDVSQELGKDIELRITGGDTEVDKTVVEKISDPLTHLLRNSMDHGIEAPEKRRAVGKSAKGLLSLNAYHDSGSIVIEIVDDGSGLNRERILKKAIERELVAANANLTDQEIYQLIFEPGFSTAEAVTNLSGRGVGMDVVKRNITALRGTVELHSQPGEGTRVRIRLPLTLAIIDGFLVEVGGASYVVPLDMVQECVELTEGDRQMAHARNYLNLRGEVLPLVFLRSHFGLNDNRSRRENVVVVRCAGQKAGLVVDELHGEYQTVIKPLGKLFTALRGISGSTILGNGAVALILDVSSLLQDIITEESKNSAALLKPVIANR